MVDNGAKVFVLAEKILSAQQGNALLGKSWKKATLQGKVLSKVANKRARLVKFHLLKQPIQETHSCTLYSMPKWTYDYCNGNGYKLRLLVHLFCILFFYAL